MNHGWTYRDQVEKSAHHWTVLDYYTRKYRHSSRAEWQQRISEGQIRLNGAKTTAETHLVVGQQLSYDRPPWQEPDVPLEFEILYEDRELVVVAKPAGLPVLPGGGFLEHTLLWQLQQRYPVNPPIPVHRLGRGTSGLLLLARSPTARAHLSQQMRQSTSGEYEYELKNHSVQKIYRALVQGTSIPDHFVVKQPIGKVPHPILGYLYAAQPQGLPAYSQFEVLRRDSETTLVEVTILTGRPHQIRIHSAAAGYPLVNDPLYTIGGVPTNLSANTQDLATEAAIAVPGDCGYHLHALYLSLTHPNNQRISFTCPPPPILAI